MSDAPLDGADRAVQSESQEFNREPRVPIRVLVVEDRPEDAELMIHELRRGWYEPDWSRVETESDFLSAVGSAPDVILADYRMPQLDAPRALELLKGLGLDIPFIVVSGAIGEDAAVAMMRQGATDYLLKDRLRRLGPAVRRALAENQLRTEKQRAEEALKASEARFYSFMNHSPALAYIKDADGRMLYMNNTCEQIWGRSLSYCEGKLDHELWPCHEAERLRAADRAVFDSGDATRSIEELPLKGGARHFLTYRFAFNDAAGCRNLGGVSMDVSEQIRVESALSGALSVKETLLREVHHRVKNNLQVISSLLNMQAESMPDPGQRRMLRVSQQRVESMAMIHDRLCSQENLDRVDFAEYVETLARDLFAAHGTDANRVQLCLHLEPVSLDLSQAIPCGLILNELVSNALKYAFPGGRHGRLDIGLSCEAKGRITLRVVDDGVGIREQENRKQSLGLGIVEVLARQLGTNLVRGSDSGVSFSLVFERSMPESAAKPFEAVRSLASP